MPTSYSDLKESGKLRLAAAWCNINDQKTALAKVDGESAALDFSSKGDISGASFKTSIGRMKGGYAPRTLPDKSRLAACFTNITEADLKPIMATIDWAKAATDFKPSGKPITAASFKTSIGRILNPKSDTTKNSGTNTTSKKRKASAAATAAGSSSPSSPSKSASNRKKNAKSSQVLPEDDAALSSTKAEQAATREDLSQPALSSKGSSRSPTPTIKAEHVDDGADSSDDLSLHNPNFFPE